MKNFIVIFLLFFASVAHGQTVTPFADDIVNGRQGSSLGFARSHWIPTIGKMIQYLVPTDFESIRGYDPVTNTWSWVWPDDVLGIQWRDNYASFYVAKRDELWVWDGSHLEPNDGAGGARWSGRFCFATSTWCARGTPALSSDPDRNNKGAFTGIVDLSGAGGIMHTSGTDPAMAWASVSDMGLMLGGSGDTGINTFVFEPKVGGPEPYKLTILQSPSTPRPPGRSQCMNCMVTDGTNFYLSGGFYQEPNDPTWRFRRDLWKFTAATKTWSELKPPPEAAYTPTLTYDSSLNAVVSWVNAKLYVYDIATDNWDDKTPPGLPCIFNQTGTYIPTTNAHYYEGGNLCDANSSSSFATLKVTLSTGGLSIPNRTWEYRPFNLANAPGAGSAAAGGGGKHFRWAQNPLTGLIHELGGDWETSGANSQITQWTLDITTNTWAREVNPSCGAQGQVLPGGPDEVGWVWDSRRNKFWMLPGFLFIQQNQVANCNAEKILWAVDTPYSPGPGYWAVSGMRDENGGNFGVSGTEFYAEGVHYSVSTDGGGVITVTNISIPAGRSVRLGLAPNGSARHYRGVMTYDPVTKLWTIVPDTGEEFGGRFAIYDEGADRIRRVSPGNDLVFTEYDPATNQRSAVAKTCAEAYPGQADPTGPCAGGGVYVGSLQPQEEYYAWDPRDRRIYLIDPHTYKMFWYGVDDHRLVQTAPIPEPNSGRIALTRSGAFGMGDFTMPVMDTVNHLVLYPYVDRLNYDPTDANSIFGSKPQLLIYHPNTDADPTKRDTWEVDPMFQPEGRTVRADSFFFDPIHNVLMGLGGLNAGSDLDGTITGYFIWRYGASAAPTQAAITVQNPSGAAIGVSVADIFGNTGASTTFTRRYMIADAKTVDLTAAVTDGNGDTFGDWGGPCGQILTTTAVVNGTCRVLATTDKVFTPHYLAGPPVPRTLFINSTNPAVGVLMAVSPNDLSAASTCMTPCQLSYNDGQTVLVTAPLTSGTASYTLWNGPNSAAGNVASVTMSAEKTISAAYVSGATYKNSVDYSNVQGQRGWRYGYLAGGVFTDMTFAAPGRWGGPEGSLLIMPGGVSHPGPSSHADLRWVSPFTGRVRVTGTVSDGDPGGGDGVNIFIQRDGATIFSTSLDNGNTTGVPYDLTVPVVAGTTRLDFIVDRKETPFNDTTLFDPLITPSAASVQFGTNLNLGGANVIFGE